MKARKIITVILCLLNSINGFTQINDVNLKITGFQKNLQINSGITKKILSSN